MFRKPDDPKFLSQAFHRLDDDDVDDDDLMMMMMMPTMLKLLLWLVVARVLPL